MTEEHLTKEYDMLRQEIMQYLEQYQNVRNMMYIITATILGFGLANANTAKYVYLLPLAVIIPSYFALIDYRDGNIKIAMYLRVFFEENDDFPIKWESRLVEFHQKQKRKDYQKVPYIVCTCVCIVLFLISPRKSNWDYLIIAAVSVACGAIFAKVKEVNSAKVREGWEEVKRNSDQAMTPANKANMGEGKL